MKSVIMKSFTQMILVALCVVVPPAAAQLLGGGPEDAQAAIQNPDEFAWQLFLALNLQAEKDSAGIPARDKRISTYEPDSPVVWETWALASGGRAGGQRTIPNKSEVFLDKGAEPSTWENLPRSTDSVKNLEPIGSKRLEFLTESGIRLPKIANAAERSSFHVMVDPTLPDRAEELFEGGPPTGDEVRMNKATYEFVRSHKLYSIEGLEAMFNSGIPITFPNTAQEVKAQWVKITEGDKPRYHWRTVKNQKGEAEIWGLSGLHIITKDLPDWFWCDFEHEDFTAWAEQPSQDGTTRGDAAPARGSKDGIRRETEGTKWAHYRLRGTQTTFTDSRGFFSVVANTQIEKGFQQTSSCITCHSRATVGLRSSDPQANQTRTYSLATFEIRVPFPVGSVGSPKSNWFVDDRNRARFIQTDFLWSLPFRACSEKEIPSTLSQLELNALINNPTALSNQ